MEKPYHIISRKDTQGLAHFLAKNGQALLPIMELIEQSKMALDELIDVLGRAQIEAILRLSAEGMTGLRHPGKKGEAIGRHGREQGRVCLKERKLRVGRPRLRKKGQGQEGEVPIPAYEAMQRDRALGSRMLGRTGSERFVSSGRGGVDHGSRRQQEIRRACLRDDPEKPRDRDRLREGIRW